MMLLLVTLLLMSMYAFWVHTGKDRVFVHQEEEVDEEGQVVQGVEEQEGVEQEEQEEQEDEEFDTFLERLDELIFQEDHFYGDDMVPGSTYIGLVGFARGNQKQEQKNQKQEQKNSVLTCSCFFYKIKQSTACHCCKPVVESKQHRISPIATTSCWRTSLSMRIWYDRLPMVSACMCTDHRRHRHVQWCASPITSPWCNGIGAAFFVVVVNAYNSEAMSPRWPFAV